MAEENTALLGGLPTTNQVPQTSQESPEVTEKPAQTPYMDPVQKARIEYETQRKALLDQQQKLIESLSVRSPSQDFFRIAQAALSPTRSGSASEGFGRIAGAMAEGESADTKRNQDLAKMRYELAQQQLGMSKEGIDLARKMGIREGFINQIGGGQPQAQPSVQPSTQPSTQISGQPSDQVPTKPLGQISAQPSGQPSSQVAQSSVMPSVVSSNQRPTILQRLDKDTQTNLLNMDEDKAIEQLLKMAQKEFETPDLVKTQQYHLNNLPPAVRDYARQYAASQAMFGDPNARIKTMIEIDTAQQNGLITSDVANQLKKFIDITPMNSQGGKTSGSLGSPSSSAPSSISGSSGSGGVNISPAQQRDINKELLTEYNKRHIAERTALLNSGESASRAKMISNSTLQLINESPDSVGIIAGPGVGNAIVGLLKNLKTNVGTNAQGVDIQVDTSALEDAIRKIGPKKLANESQADYEKRRDNAVNVASVIARNLAEMELVAAKSFLKGQGTVANMERLIVRGLSGSVSDSLTALRAKTEMTIKTADYDEKIRDAYLDWEKKNPSERMERFKTSSDYKRLIDGYNSEITNLNQKYFGKQSSGSSGSSPSTTNQDLRRRLDSLMGG
jgi:hypothetical protein